MDKKMEELTLEEAMSRLEKTAVQMEGTELSLEQMMKLYKEGILLARHCERLLDRADKELMILEQEIEEHE